MGKRWYRTTNGLGKQIRDGCKHPRLFIMSGYEIVNDFCHTWLAGNFDAGMILRVCNLKPSLRRSVQLDRVIDSLAASVNGLCVLINVSTLALLDKPDFHNWEKLYALSISSDVHTCSEVDEARDSISSTHHETRTEISVLVHVAVKIKTVAIANTVEEANEVLKRS